MSCVQCREVSAEFPYGPLALRSRSSCSQRVTEVHCPVPAALPGARESGMVGRVSPVFGIYRSVGQRCPSVRYETKQSVISSVPAQVSPEAPVNTEGMAVISNSEDLGWFHPHTGE